MEETTAIFTALCVLAGIKYSVLLTGYRKKPRTAKLVGKLSAIYYYPVKSCGFVELQEATCTQSGLKPKNSSLLDRHLCVCDPESQSFLTQRQEPTLSLVTPSVTANGELKLQAPNESPIIVPLPQDGTVIPCRIWADRQQCFDCGPEVEKWLTKYLGRRRSLVFAADKLTKRSERQLMAYIKPPMKRPFTSPHERVAFADYSSYLLATEASMEDLNGRLSQAVPITNFRPNIVVSNKTAFDEDTWDEIFINNVRFRTVKSSERCTMTTVDTSIGERRMVSLCLKFAGVRKNADTMYCLAFSLYTKSEQIQLELTF